MDVKRLFEHSKKFIQENGILKTCNTSVKNYLRGNLDRDKYLVHREEAYSHFKDGIVLKYVDSLFNEFNAEFLKVFEKKYLLLPMKKVLTIKKIENDYFIHHFDDGNWRAKLESLVLGD